MSNISTVPFHPRPQEETLFAILKQNYVTVFGGYIRDVLLNVTPSDVDCVVESSLFSKLNDDLVANGYKSIEINLQNVSRYEKDGQLPIEVIVEDEYTHLDLIIGPCATPDVDINTLSYACVGKTKEEYALTSWTGGCTTDKIIHKLQNGCRDVRIASDISDVRKEKILQKGFQIVGVSW